MITNKRDFDSQAAGWDELPRRVKLANDIVLAIKEEVPLAADMNILDFGCGTGLLSLALQPHVHSVIGVDSSRGMLDVFQAKIDKLKLNNVRTQFLEIDKGERLEGCYNLIVCSMTLHHILDIAPLLAQFCNVTAPGGHLCIADLDLDDGKFHTDPTGVFHNGFDRAALRQSFIDAGYAKVKDRTAAEVVKPGANGQESKFSIFLMSGKK